MKTDKIRKFLLPNIPYLFIGWAILKISTAYRMAAGADFLTKAMGIGQTIGPAFADLAPGLNPVDWLVGIVGAVGFRLLIYMKSKKAKKFRRDEEYGSARWGNEKDIKPFVDPQFSNNVILTGTEFLTMNTRPKVPANARNLNCCIIGSSGSGKTRKQTECDGQTGYTAHTLDGIIDKLVRQIFERMKAVPKSEIVNVRYKEKMDERRALLRSIRADYTKAAGELEMLRAEVIKSLRGESAFSQSLLGSLIADAETKCLEVQQQLEAAQAAYDEGQAVLASLNAQYDDIISWADMYDTASIEAKKMIVNCLIKRVDVYRDYKLHIDFNIDFEQFSMGLDIVWIAA